MSRLLNNNKVLLFIIAILLITNIAMLVFYFARPCGRPGDRFLPPKEAMGMFLKNEVKFTPKQMKLFDSLRDDHRQQMRPLFKKINAAKDNFYLHIRDGALIEDPLFRSSLDSIASIQKMIDSAMFFHFRNVRMICTPQQLPIYDSLAQHLIKRMMNPYRRPERLGRPGEMR